MFLRDEINTCKKEMASLYKLESDLQSRYDEIQRYAGCIQCNKFNRDTVSKISDRHFQCTECESCEEAIGLCNQIDMIHTDIEDYIENVYARAVFKKYSKQNPLLVRRNTGETVAWKDAFGDSFENVTKSLRHSLVGLVEGAGRYKLR